MPARQASCSVLVQGACARDDPGDHDLIFRYGSWLTDGDEKPLNVLRGPCLAPPSHAAGGGQALAEHAARGQRGAPATAPVRRVRVPRATYARGVNVRRWRGEERADKTCSFHQFHPGFDRSSSPSTLPCDHRSPCPSRADSGTARLLYAAAPTVPSRARVVASCALFYACARCS